MPRNRTDGNADERPATVDMEHRVTPLELFFDLVFVFGFTQVTTLLHNDATWAGLARGMLALGVLWWAWSAYAWLTNLVDANSGPVIATMLIAAGAMFLAALALPEAFDEHRVVFAVSFVVVLAMFLVLLGFASTGEPDLLRTVRRATPWIALGGALIVLAAFVGSGARPFLWLVAVAAGVAGPAVRNLRGVRVHAAHFAERHGLIVLIAIGESLAAIGLGARTTTLGAAVIAAVILGFVIAASFWLAYFDFFSIALQRLLARQQGVQRATLARDVYSYLHLPMIAGIVLFAYAMRAVVADVHSRLETIPALALCLGSAVYLGAHVGLRRRVTRTLGRGRLTATVAFLLIFPATLFVPALAAVALCAGIWAGLHAYELIWWREQRAQRRAGVIPETDVVRAGTL